MARTPSSSELEIDTAQGRAVVRLTEPSAARCGGLVLGHGAGGGISAPDLLAVRAAAVAAGWAVALVVQPWKVAGRRVATAPPRLDAAWLDVVRQLVAGAMADDVPLVVGGRSAGARVACRTAQALDADGVCCLAFPLHPPGRPDRSRAAELPGRLPTLIVQGRHDPFGTPEEVSAVAPAGVRVVPVNGDHALRTDVPALTAAVIGWLGERNKR